MNQSGRAALVCVLLTVSFAAGCSSEPAKPATFPVSGTVTRNGQPVVGATLIFVPSATGAEAAIGMTDAEGRYQLTTFTSGDGARAGEYRVKISQYGVPATPAGGKTLSHEEEQKIYKEDETPAPPPKNLLPTKYENEGTSGITHTVKDGPTTLDIKIE